MKEGSSLEHIHGTYNSSLVVFSYIIAVAASYTALNVAGQVGLTKGKAKWLWLSFGAITMGLGIWSMHFVGMLAFSLPFEVIYDTVIVAVSAISAIAGSFVALYFIQSSRRKLSVRALLVGGLLLALGIVVMHYVGMLAMRVGISYNPLLFLLSIVIAIIASLAAVWLAVYFQKEKESGINWKRLCSGLIMGAAISGMHYVGMYAASFYEEAKPVWFIGFVLDQNWLATVISLVVLLTLGLSLLGIFISQRLASKDSEIENYEKWYKSLYDNNQDGIISLDLNRRATGFNGMALHILGLKSQDILHKPVDSLLELVVEEDRTRMKKLIDNGYAGETVSAHIRIAVHKAERIDSSTMVIPVIIEGGVVGAYVIFKDITEDMRNQKKINHLAYHDELTDLPNRRLLNQSIEECMAASEAQGSSFAVMMLDIDRFKMVNDTLGHTYGDLFIKEVSRRISAIVEREDVMLARIGGDEFAMVLRSYKGPKTSGELAERILSGIRQPYRLKDNDIYISASIGIAVFPEHGSNVLELIKHADTAMYNVKDKGKNSYAFYSEELDEKLLEKLELEAEMRKGLERHEFVLHYQPQFHSDESRIVGVEALVRWNHPTKGLLFPGSFIAVAEESGLIRELGAWVLREACRQMKEWQLMGGPRIPVSVNLSSQQFHEHRFADFVKTVLDEAGLEPQYLEIEITESMMMDASLSSSVLNKLSEYGIRISLDDFGTGYSSLSYLKLFPIQKLKIDRSFIRDITSNENDKAIVATIIAMAKHLKMDVIAEGIETKEQFDVLLEQGCSEIQGYYFSKPLPVSDLEKMIFAKV